MEIRIKNMTQSQYQIPKKLNKKFRDSLFSNLRLSLAVATDHGKSDCKSDDPLGLCKSTLSYVCFTWEH